MRPCHYSWGHVTYVYSFSVPSPQTGLHMSRVVALALAGIVVFCSAVRAEEVGPDWVKVSGDPGWQARDSSGEIVFKDKMWLLGGWYDSFHAPPRDVWNSADGKAWHCVEKDAPWKYSDLGMTLAFGDAMWFMGGWTNGRLAGHGATNEVWSSTDGAKWQSAGKAGWSPRLAAAVVEFKGRMWMLGGSENYYFGDDKSLKNDVWSSSDGKVWTQETPAAGWSPRAYHQAVVLNDTLYVFGGGNYVPKYHALNDVWSSTDGKTWKQVTESAGWSPRLWFSSVVYRGRMWVLGGWSNNPSKNWGDVWYSTNGKDWTQLVSQVIWKPRHEHSSYVFQDKIWVAGGHASPLSSEVWSLELPHPPAEPPGKVPSETDPPPVAVWGKCPEVDEPESAFSSLGRTMWHFGRNPVQIVAFHEWLRAKGVEPTSLLPRPTEPPADLRRILIEPERMPTCGWMPSGEWIVSTPGHRGTEARFPLSIDRTNLYRLWIRYHGHAKGTAVTHLTLYRKGGESEAPLLYEEFHTQACPEDGPRWHDFLVDLPKGDYTVVLGHVVRYYHTPQQVPFLEHKVDCLYLTDAIWADEPTEESLASLRGMSHELQSTARPVTEPAQREVWRLWQVRPSHWEDARKNETLFRHSHAFWRQAIAAIAQKDYTAPPIDSVRGGIADYRDPRRQVIFDPVWNMVGNPFRIKQQIEVLQGDIDTGPAAKDASFEYVYPGHFPVVAGQWVREGGGLSADHGAMNALALGRYTVPEPGTWHIWAQFKNINYFEYFTIHASTAMGQKIVWQRNQRLYPGGRAAWAKVGALDVPSLTPEQIEAHKARAASGIYIAKGEPLFVNPVGEWKREGLQFLNAAPKSFVFASNGLQADEDFRIVARLTLTDKPAAGSGFCLKDRHGLQDSFIDFDGTVIGPSFEAGATNQIASQIEANKPFDLEITRKGMALAIRVNGADAGTVKLIDKPVGRFGFRSGSNTLCIESFSATGKLDDGLEMRKQISLALVIDNYYNPRTYRGVYRLFVTNDGDYKPEGNLLPKPSLARYESQLEACGATPDAGYVLNVMPGVGSISQTWMPGPEPAQPSLDVGMARDTTRSASLLFRNVRNQPLVVHIAPQPLAGKSGSYPESIRWRVVGFAPYGDGREEWTPFFLLRRPFLIVPPRSTAQAWLTFDSTGMPAGDYSAPIRITATDCSGQKIFPPRTVAARVSVANTSVAPRKPILMHGWVYPPPGEEYLVDWFKRFNVWQGPFFSKADMVKYGLQQQIWCQRHADGKQIRDTVAQARAKGLGTNDWMMSVMDEPTGKTVAELQDYLAIGKLIREVDPAIQITMNPGEAAAAATFQILQPFVDFWNPYKLHLSFGPSGRDYLKKPWMWYTTPCYQDKSPGIAAEMYDQIRSVLSQPGDCRGTAFFAPYYPWRDPWDTAYEHIKDVSVFVLPSRHGPVATPAWESIREAVQHANLAKMVRERAKPGDSQAQSLWETGSVEAILEWLRTHP